MNKIQCVLALLILQLCFIKTFAQQTNSKENYSEYLNKLIANQPKGTGLSVAQIAKDRIAKGGTGLPANFDTIIKPTIKTIKGPAGNILLLVFKPDTVRCIVLEIHGGGWFSGSAADDAKSCDQIARKCNAAVVSVNYRLAPENPFPACIDDCEAAAKWLINNSEKEFGTDKLFISGASAGSHLAAVTTLYIRDSLKSIDKVKGVNLFYGVYDLGRTPSFRLITDSSFLPKKFMEEMMELVFHGWSTDRLQQPQYSPLFADLHGLPPALFTVGTADPLADDTYFMESRWRASGNKTFLAVYPGSPHGFDFLSAKLAQISHERVYKWINDLLK